MDHDRSVGAVWETLKFAGNNVAELRKDLVKFALVDLLIDVFNQNVGFFFKFLLADF